MKDWIIELCPEIADWQAELIDEAVAARIADEREACAKVADYYATGMERNYSEIIADAIRARGETKCTN
jgi:hypothetical protein